MNSYDLTDGQEPVSHAEIDYLKELATWLPSHPKIVNIGAATGVSTCAFLEQRPDATIYSVDVLECPEEFENVERCGLDRKRVKRVLGDSKFIGKAWVGQCDLLFIDGDHWNAYGDIEAWVYTEKVKPGGVIALHDWQLVCAPNNPGSVYEDVERGLMGKYELIGQVGRVIAFRMP